MADLLVGETILDLTTVARVNMLLGNARAAYKTTENGLIRDAEIIDPFIKTVSRQARINVMNRAFAKAEYDEWFNVTPGQRDFWMTGSPIAIPTDIDTDIAAYNNIDNPRGDAQSGDEIDADFINIKSAGQRSGKIHFDRDLIAGENTLQVIYTGGMASELNISGVNGSTVATDKFTATGQTFSAKGVAVNDILAITTQGATDHGLWRIGNVDSETVLEVSALINTDATVATFTATASSLTYEIIDGGNDTLVSLYPHICHAIDRQVAYMFQQRARAGISAEVIVGANITYFKGAAWLKEVLAVLQGEARNIE